MRTIGRWVFRGIVVWGAGKAWQAYQDRKAREQRGNPAA